MPAAKDRVPPLFKAIVPAVIWLTEPLNEPVVGEMVRLPFALTLIVPGELSASTVRAPAVITVMGPTDSAYSVPIWFWEPPTRLMDAAAGALLRGTPRTMLSRPTVRPLPGSVTAPAPAICSVGTLSVIVSPALPITTPPVSPAWPRIRVAVEMWFSAA